MCYCQRITHTQYLLMNSLLMFSVLVALLSGMALGQTQNDDEVTVSIGNAKPFGDTAVEVKFVEVLEDSRCPEGVDCFWAGNARIRIEVNRNHKTSMCFELDTNGPTPFVNFDGFRITFKALDPYPKADKPVDRSAYRATLVISKSK